MSVSLRPLRPSDWKAVEEWLHDPETSRYMVMARTAPSAERWCREQAEAWPRSTSMVIINALKICGVVGLYDIDWLARKSEFRIFMGTCRGTGLGTEATRIMLRHGFEALGLHRIWLGTAAENEWAQRCFKKAGFQYEGALKDDFWTPDGRYTMNYRYAILKPEWEKQNEDGHGDT